MTVVEWKQMQSEVPLPEWELVKHIPFTLRAVTHDQVCAAFCKTLLVNGSDVHDLVNALLELEI